MPTVLLHITSEDAVMGELDELPSGADTMIFVRNPQRRDGKEIQNLAPDVRYVIWPVHRITYLEIMPTDEEDEIISFVRE